MITTVLDDWPRWLAVAVAAVTVLAYVCRLTALDPRRHQLSVGLLHLALCWVALVCGARVWQDGLTPLQVLGLCLAGAWIVASYPVWRHGVPQHVVRRGAGSAVAVRRPETG